MGSSRTFKYSLCVVCGPIVVGKDAAQLLPQVRLRTNRPTGRTFMSLSIDIFDDDAIVRRALQIVCERRGHRVRAYSDPGEYFIDTASGPPCPPDGRRADVVISDVNMPYMNGIDFAQRLIAAGHAQAHIALISGDWNLENLERASQLGCKLFPKPFDLREMMGWLAGIEPSATSPREASEWQAHHNA